VLDKNLNFSKALRKHWILDTIRAPTIHERSIS